VYTFMVERGAKTSVLKRLLSEKLGVAPEKSVLIYKGQVLEDNLNAVCEDAPLLLKSCPIKRSLSASCLTPPKNDSAYAISSMNDKSSSGGTVISEAMGSDCSTSPSVCVISRWPRGESMHSSMATSVSEEAPPEVACPFAVVGSARCAAAVKPLVRKVVEGVRVGQAPKLEKEGHGGTYFFKDAAGNYVALVKPTDEEPLAPNNPKGFVGRALGDPGLKKSIRVGEAALREAAAFLLDHQSFARVPRTALVKASHPVFNINAPHIPSSPHSPHAIVGTPTKLASFQEYVPHEFDASEQSTSRFGVSDVHRLGILDVRLFNTDRHSGNILVRKKKHEPMRRKSNRAQCLVREAGLPRPHSGMRLQDFTAAANKESAKQNGVLSSISRQHCLSAVEDFTFKQHEELELIPIDHGYCLPEMIDGVYFEWLYWPQAAQPFSDEELMYISALDVRKDIEMLRGELPMLREESLRMLEVSTTVLQRGASYGLSLAEIGNIMSRPLGTLDEEPSEMEVLCYRAMTMAREETAGPERPLGASRQADEPQGVYPWSALGSSNVEIKVEACAPLRAMQRGDVPVQQVGFALEAREGVGRRGVAPLSVGVGQRAAIGRGRLCQLEEEQEEVASDSPRAQSKPPVVRTNGFIVRKSSLLSLDGATDMLNSSYRNLQSLLAPETMLFELDDESSASTSPTKTPRSESEPFGVHSSWGVTVCAVAGAVGRAHSSRLQNVSEESGLSLTTSSPSERASSPAPSTPSERDSLAGSPGGSRPNCRMHGPTHERLLLHASRASKASPALSSDSRGSPLRQGMQRQLSTGSVQSVGGLTGAFASGGASSRASVSPLPPSGGLTDAFLSACSAASTCDGDEHEESETVAPVVLRRSWGDESDDEEEEEEEEGMGAALEAASGLVARHTLWGDAEFSSEDEEEQEEVDHFYRPRAVGVSSRIAVPETRRRSHCTSRTNGAANFLDASGESPEDSEEEDTIISGSMAMAQSMLTFRGRHKVASNNVSGGRTQKSTTVSRLTGAHARQQRLGRGIQESRQRTVCLGDMDDRRWRVFRTTLASLLDSLLKERKWKSSLQLVTQEGTRLQNNFGTSCPRF